MLAGRVAIVLRLAGQVVLRRDDDVAPPLGLAAPPGDRRLGPVAVVQSDHRRVAPQRVVLRRQEDGVLGRRRVVVVADAAGLRLARPLVAVRQGGRHPLDQPRQQVELPRRDRLRRLVGELQRLERLQRPGPRVGVAAGEVIADQVARLPGERRGVEVGDRGVGAGGVARHRQREPRLVRRPGLGLRLLPGDEAVADGVGSVGQGPEGLQQRFLPRAAPRRGDALGQRPQLVGQGAVGGGLRVVAADLVADLDQQLGGDVLARERRQPLAHPAGLLRPAAEVDLGLELRRAELDDRGAGVGHRLAQLGELGGDRVELGAGLVVPLRLDQEPRHAEPLVLVGPLDLPQQPEHHLAGDLRGGLAAVLPEAVDPADVDEIRPELVDRLLHRDPLGRARADVLEHPPAPVVPGRLLDDHRLLGHRPGVDDQRLDELEPLPVAVGGVRLDLGDLRVVQGDPPQAVEDPDDRIVAVDRAPVDDPVLEDDVVAVSGAPRRQGRHRQGQGDDDPGPASL